MNVEDLYRLASDPSALGADTLPELRRLVADYPYFQLAILLYLKNLAVVGDPDFQKELMREAILLPDRKKLFRFIEGDKYGLRSHAEEKPVSDVRDSFSIIETFLSGHGEDLGEGERNPLLFQPSVSSDYMSWSLAREANPSEEPVERSKFKHQDLIDSFLRNERERVTGAGLPARESGSSEVQPDPVDPIDDEPSRSLEDSCLTETLARIYIKQRRYDKALQIIKNLSLKYPEKNIYFADQIRFLEKLIINTKK